MVELRKAIAQLMQGRRELPTTGASLVEQLAAHALLDAPPAERPLLQAFIPLLFNHNEPPNLSMAQLVAIARNALRFIRRRDHPWQSRVYRADRVQHGWDSPYAVVEVLSDRAVHADAVRDAVQGTGGRIQLLLQAAFVARRDAHGELGGLIPANGAAEAESFVHAQVSIADMSVIERALARLQPHPPTVAIATVAVATPAPIPTAAIAELSTASAHHLLDRWDAELRQHLAARYGPGEVERLASRYLAAFPPAYKTTIAVPEALGDIRALEVLSATGTTQVELLSEATQPDRLLTNVKLYLLGERLVLSDFVPVLENLGLRVFGESCTTVLLPEAGTVNLQTFLVQDALHGQLDVARAAPLLVSALHAVRTGQCENDPLNRLILHAGLEWRAVTVLRTYVEHARQAGVAASRSMLFEALTAHPDSARRLFRLFTAKFDPAVLPSRPAERLTGPIAEAEAAFEASLDHVDSLVHDRLLRALGAGVSATVRTNFYRPPIDGSEGKVVAVKLDGRRLSHVPPPRPLFETYVHAPDVDGIHLRAGRVARGGIRLSDRPDDFRSEVLGLMQTQMVKNAIIVPVAATGGFVLKRTSPSPAHVEAAYRSFVSALLAVSDNLEHGEPVSPPGQLCYDETDAYLVVAADRGTATLSDTANDIAARYRFWLGDAFASGGSHGYDHKQLGITARGAWESVRQHFRAMGRDADGEPLTVVGIGDMSGDVFGNGLLRGPHLLLRAAFNHSHIFLDPTPDGPAAHAERQRLFQQPNSGWNDYQASRISAGGGVYSRRAKHIRLGPAAQAMLGVAHESLSGEALVRAVLTMDADLLWSAGIGTYIKASTEVHAEVGDSSNDRVRVDANALRVRVVAEGGNRGFTQAARVEFALRGGRINSDAIDNSAGVDLSDHEVNLKIALQPLVATHVLSTSERTVLLNELCEDVCARVVAHNRRQALVLAVDQIRSRRRMVAFRELTALLHASTALDRQFEELPSREALRARRGTYLGMTRPELASLLAYTKIDLQHRILAASLSDDPRCQRYFEHYFPARVIEQHGDAVRRHPLRREIIAAELANQLLDRMGMTFAVRIANTTGHEIAAVVRAWTAAVQLGDAEREFDGLDAAVLADDPERVHSHCMALEAALEGATRWLLRAYPNAASIADLTVLDGLVQQVVQTLSAHRGAAAAHPATGAPDAAIAGEIPRLAALADALEISYVAAESSCTVAAAVDAYAQSEALVDTTWIRGALEALADSDDRWERRAVEGLLENLVHARRRLARDLLAGGGGAPGLDHYRAAHAAELDALRTLIDDLRSAAPPTLAALVVVMRGLGRLAGASG